MILAGDIGGTKVNLAVFEETNGRLEKREERKFESRGYPGLVEILDEYLQGKSLSLSAACFGVAGPVKDGKCQVTNLPWNLDVVALKTRLGLDAVWLINDLAAMAASVPFLEADELECLQPGIEEEGRIAVLAAGTGLGQAFLVPDPSGRYLILDSEGGHADFAPRNEQEADLLRFSLRHWDRVSVERILSGPGLVHLYRFFLERTNLAEPPWIVEQFKNEDRGAVVTRNALGKRFPPCEQALDLFVSLYGAVAGNLALQVMTRGGVYVGGGIAPQIISALKGGVFQEAFVAKGRFRPFLEQIPVRVIFNDKAALLGAARYAQGEKFVRN